LEQEDGVEKEQKTEKFNFHGKVVLVTGVSAGIGRAIVRELAQCGMLVAGCARRVAVLEEITKELQLKGQKFLGIEADLRDVSSIESMFAKVTKELGPVDVLINNAGIGHKMSMCSGSTGGKVDLQSNVSKWREMLDVNIIALCAATQLAVESMMKRKVAGHIIHISSLAGHRIPQDSSIGLYAATKFGVRALAEALRKELRENQSPIRISCISPGLVETEFQEKYQGSTEKAKETYSKFKCLQAEDMASTVKYVLSVPLHMEINDVLVRPTSQVY